MTILTILIQPRFQLFNFFFQCSILRSKALNLQLKFMDSF